MAHSTRHSALRSQYASQGSSHGRLLHTPHSALRVYFLLAITLAALAGCQPSADAPRAAVTTATANASAPEKVKINLTTGDAKTLDGLIAGHKGNVVFVDCWATWCGPCVEGFPHTVALAKKYAPEGLATIAVSFDQLDDESKVREFLLKQGAGFENLLSKYDGVNQRAAEDFDVEALPQYRLYDRQGKLRGKWEGQSDEIEPKIRELLAEQR